MRDDLISQSWMRKVEHRLYDVLIPYQTCNTITGNQIWQADQSH